MGLPPTGPPQQCEARGEPRARRASISRAQFIHHRQEGHLEQEYEVGAKKGEGTQGVVFLATRRSDQAVRAVKQVPKAALRSADMQAFKREVNIMKRLDHPNIVKLYDTFEDRRYTYLVMELCAGGELLDRILAQRSLTESHAAVVIQQVLRAVYYMHENDTVHRDLKPENFLLAQEGPIAQDNLLKLIDFGIACECKPGQVLTELRGTPFYVAPQVVTRRYDRKCDIWSVGVIMYVLLSGSVPFHAPSDAEILQKVRAGVVHYDTRQWGHLSADAQCLVKMLLTRNAQNRPSAQEALSHDWIKFHAPQAQASLGREVVRKLCEFRRHNLVKKAALQIVAGEMDDAQMRGVRTLFTALDKNGDGRLTCSEIREGISKAGVEIPTDLQDIMRAVDANGSGVIDYTEFLAATLDRRNIPELACRRAFDKFDRDGDGRIRAEEIIQALGNGAKQRRHLEDEAAAIVREHDSQGTGTLGFQEFYQMMRSVSSRSRAGSAASPCELEGLWEEGRGPVSEADDEDATSDDPGRPIRLQARH